MDSAPLVSICIANFNGIGLIDACIASIQAQTCTAAVEVIVHDDASTDASVAHLRAAYPEVRLIESSENVGFCVANNRMAQAARGDYLLLLNNDATLLPDALVALLTEAQRLGSPSILTLPQYDADTGALLDIGCRLDPFLNPVPNLDPLRNDVGTVHGACLWIDKVLWDEMGGFPEWFGSIGEDLYLCCRARLAGHPVRAVGVSGYRHRVGQSFGGGKARDGALVSTFRRRALSERNKTFTMTVIYPTPALLVLLPLHLLLLLVEGCLLSMMTFDAAYLRRIYLPVSTGLLRYRSDWMALRHAVGQDRRPASAGFWAAFDWLPHKLRMLLRYGLPRLY